MSNQVYRRNCSTPPAMAGADTSCPFFIGVAGGTASGKVVKRPGGYVRHVTICHPIRPAFARR